MGFIAGVAGIRYKRTTPAGRPAGNKSTYRGVQVIGDGPNCCEAVQAAAGKRFLSHEVPMLPLTGCAADDCRCRYELFDDRRTEVRRGSDVVLDIASQLYEQDDRRSVLSGRRSDDQYSATIRDRQ